ncbi:MAG: FAD-dependent oxidoreductase [Desulfobacteraceae bacterium]|nr:MAG: FAD-dependent oxidoreductase [Desulfobacteraceae bacterium]
MGTKRVQRKDFITPLCTRACPAGVDVPRYIRAARAGNYDEALAVLREKLPLPTVCADACFAPCEEMCAYRQFGEPVAIRAIKRAVVDRGKDGWKKRKKIASRTGRSVAIVGAGPAGLTAAYYLATKGHDVTVFDAFPKPGGMLRYGIPSYRLPEQRLEKDISSIMEWGVRFQGNTVIGRDIPVARLKKDFDAVFLAGGANGSARIFLEGSKKKGVLWGWDFLRDVKLGKIAKISGDTIVVGGGNVAIDVALTSRRLGARKVHLFCLEKREEMPAHGWEIARAEEEGVLIHNSWAPRKVLGDRSATGLSLIRCRSVFDKEGNFHPSYDEATSRKADGSTIVLAVGQAAELDYLAGEKSILIEKGRIKADQKSLATGAKAVFAGGDVVTGPQSIISAIGHGRKAAASIDLFLGGNGKIEEVLAKPEKEVLLPDFLVEPNPRSNMALLKAWERTSGFDQVERGLEDRQVAAEAERCLQCDARRFEVVLNTEHCKECGYCAEVCQVGTFGPADFFNAKGYRPQEVKSSDWCVGCSKCYFACPDFAIDIRESAA